MLPTYMYQETPRTVYHQERKYYAIMVTNIFFGGLGGGGGGLDRLNTVECPWVSCKLHVLPPISKQSLVYEINLFLFLWKTSHKKMTSLT